MREGHQAVTTEGEGVFLPLPGLRRPVARPVEADGGGDEPRLVDNLEEQVRYLRPQLDEAHRANADHRQLLAAALARAPALEAPPEAREAPEAASEGVGQDTRDGGSQKPSERHSWRHRFFFGPE